MIHAILRSAACAASASWARTGSSVRSAVPLLLLLPLLTLAPTRAEAQQSTGALELGVVDARDFTGLTAIAGLEVRTLLLFARTAADIGFGNSDSGVERRGDTCRDIESGEAVNDSRCVSLDGGLTFRGGLDFPIQGKRLQLGVGYRLANSQSGVVGSASLRWPRGSGWWAATLEVGDGLLRATGGIGFGLGRSTTSN